MGRLVYAMNVSLDGYAAAPDGSLDWADVDEEVHAWWNDQVRSSAAALYGRRMYETMSAYWPTAADDPAAPSAIRDFAVIWNAQPKIVFSRTLASVTWNSRLAAGEPEEELTRLKAEFDGDLEVSGPTLAAEFIRRGLVDEYGLVVHPVILGGGLPFFPGRERPVGLRLTETRTFGSGAVLLRYAAR
jgi:dihydrofolate reductase